MIFSTYRRMRAKVASWTGTSHIQPMCDWITGDMSDIHKEEGRNIMVSKLGMCLTIPIIKILKLSAMICLKKQQINNEKTTDKQLYWDGWGDQDEKKRDIPK